jgi:hypothetical protein
MPMLAPSDRPMRTELRAQPKRRTWPLFLLVAAATTAGCDRHGEERAEARELMTSINAVSDEGSLSRRSAALDRLGRLPLRVESHVQTRDVCRTAHLALLEAETAQTQARRALATSDKSLDARQTTVIAADIERSNRALATARQRFPQCETAMRELLRTAH